MVAYIFDDILNRGASQAPQKTADARTWYRNQASKIAASPMTLMNSDRSRMRKIPLLGSMYLFKYDPKYKETLPYYDTFPLIFPIASTKSRGIASSGPAFYGINLHYLPLRLRARLMDALYSTATNKTIDETTRLKISYNILSSASKYKYFQPCIKQYLFKHVRSQFFYVAPQEWDIALFMPLERFKKATKAAVHRQSIRGIK